MSDIQSPILPEQGELTTSARDLLIESIYRIALEPQAYDSFMGHWDSYISGQLDGLNHLKSSNDTQAQTSSNPEIETHFQIAAQLLDQIGRPDPNIQEQGGARNPQMLVDAKGRIVWSSSAASQIFALGPIATIGHLPLDSAQHAALELMKNALENPREMQTTRNYQGRFY